MSDRAVDRRRFIVGSADIAGLLGISANTVKTHLRLPTQRLASITVVSLSSCSTRLKASAAPRKNAKGPGRGALVACALCCLVLDAS